MATLTIARTGYQPSGRTAAITSPVRVDLLTREYPPEVYGGAGVHVEYLARELRRLADVRVHCFGGAARRAGRDRRTPTRRGLAGANAALRTIGVDLEMAAGCAGTDLVHSHTWYANLAGHVAKLLHGVPHVVTAHSLEPLRPWKAEQLGGGYALSSWVERTALEAADAVIAVSAGMRRDVLRCYPDVDPDRVHVVHNGIDTEEYAARPRHRRARAARHRPGPADGASSSAGSPARRACPTCCARRVSLARDVQLVLLAGAPDTPEIAAEVTVLVDELRSDRATASSGSQEMLPKPEVDPGAHARHGVRLPVDLRADGHRQPRGDGLRDAGRRHRHRRHPRGRGRRRDRPAGADRAGRPTAAARRWTRPRSWPTWRRALNRAARRPGSAPRAMGGAGRRRAVEHFSWAAIAARTLDLYRTLL